MGVPGLKEIHARKLLGWWCVDLYRDGNPSFLGRIRILTKICLNETGFIADSWNSSNIFEGFFL